MRARRGGACALGRDATPLPCRHARNCGRSCRLSPVSLKTVSSKYPAAFVPELRVGCAGAGQWHSCAPNSPPTCTSAPGRLQPHPTRCQSVCAVCAAGAYALAQSHAGRRVCPCMPRVQCAHLQGQGQHPPHRHDRAAFGTCSGNGACGMARTSFGGVFAPELRAGRAVAGIAARHRAHAPYKVKPPAATPAWSQAVLAFSGSASAVAGGAQARAGFAALPGPGRHGGMPRVGAEHLGFRTTTL